MQVLAEHYPAMRVLNATALDALPHPALYLANRSAGMQAVFQLAGFLLTMGTSPLRLTCLCVADGVASVGARRGLARGDAAVAQVLRSAAQTVLLRRRRVLRGYALGCGAAPGLKLVHSALFRPHTLLTSCSVPARVIVEGGDNTPAMAFSEGGNDRSIALKTAPESKPVAAPSEGNGNDIGNRLRDDSTTEDNDAHGNDASASASASASPSASSSPSPSASASSTSTSTSH